MAPDPFASVDDGEGDEQAAAEWWDAAQRDIDRYDPAEEPPARRQPMTVRKLSGAVMVGMARALGQIYDPKPPPDIEIEQEADDDQLDPDQPVRIILGDTPATSVARIRRP